MWLFRFLHLIAIILIGCLAIVVCWPLSSQRRRDDIERWWSKAVLNVLRVRVALHGQWPQQATLMAFNHISWVDIFAVNAISPLAFIAKSEIADWPVAGFLAIRSGTIFIERGKRHAVRTAIHTARDNLLKGRCVGVFPEGTTSIGENVLPFHSNLLQAALEAKVNVLPVSLRYCDVDNHFTTLPAFIGEQTLLDNLLGMLKSKRGFIVHLNVGQAIDVSGLTRHDIAEQAEQAIKQTLGVAT
jgi:1-acyl-sn-glycerol-3-phosphate acyltransferase